jgi:hypothetical protein
MEDCLTIRGPWGNRFHIYSLQDDDDDDKDPPITKETTTPQKMTNLHSEGGAYGAHRMAVRGQAGIRYIELACPKGKATAIARFYREMLGCTVTTTETTTTTTTTTTQQNNVVVACSLVCVGPGVHLCFVEQQDDDDAVEANRDVQAMMEGVHVCFYADDFEGLYGRLLHKNLIWTNPRFVHLDTCDTWEEAFASRTLRFKDIIDLSTGDKIMELEHETRPLRHGQYLKVPKYEPK